ncbi:MAG TPA: branched-chain amino acid ABC transporter substrate-binding protein [Dermatophilaceae bacterium]|nr:branched-chain amino acid ABC transporter substrate-binding protein [Dermatophilaceae bacterium]
MSKYIKVAAVVAVASLGLAACASSGGDGGTSGSKTLVISSDLPLQGGSADASISTNNMIKLYLKSLDNKVGDYTIEFKEYDNSTAAKGSWDDATCAANAQAHVANTNEVAVMGTYNSGCAKIIAPVLNQAPDGPMLMVSHANTNPGLTKTWDPGEPEKYFPSGTRSYARVVTTDDYQGAAIAAYAGKELGLKKCYIVNDNQTYGQGVARSFVDSAEANGIEVVGNDPWDSKQTSYTALFEKAKAKNPDCIIMSGVYDLNGGQLIKDKVAVLGDNEKVKVLAPDGFVGYPDFQAQPEAEGVFLTFAGLSLAQLAEAGGAAQQLLADYETEYGEPPSTGYALYGTAAVQVILAAIEASDGTRKGVNAAVFSGSGLTVDETTSAIGKAFTIDPATGDIDVKDISVLQIQNGAEVFVKAIPVS